MKKDTSKWIKIEENLLVEFCHGDIDDFQTFLSQKIPGVQVPNEQVDALNSHKVTIKKLSSRSPVSRQHYVPQFYLKKFTNDTGRLETCSLKLRKVIKSQSPKEVCCSVYFYANKEGEYDILSQLVEDLMGVHESKFAGMYDRIVSLLFAGQQISDEDLYELCIFASIGWMRSKSFRKTSNHSISKGFNDAGLGSLVEDRLENNRRHIEFLTNPDNIYGFANLLYGKKVRIYISKGERNFVASDAGVVEVHPELKSFYGNSFFERIHYFPLHPKILIEFSDPKLPGKKMKRKEVTGADVMYYNYLIAMFSDFIYAPLKTDLEEKYYTATRTNFIEKLCKLFPKMYHEDMVALNRCKGFAKEKNIHYRDYEELVDKVGMYDIMQTHGKGRTEKEFYEELKSIDIVKEVIKMQRY